MFSEAYSLLNLGLAACSRMGLHLNPSSQREDFSPTELAERRQVYAALCMLDTYTSTMLGLPTMIKDPDAVQVLAIPKDELADEGTSFIQRNPTSPITATLLCNKLWRIQAKISDTRLAAREDCRRTCG
jgi:hypothetical protein